MDGTLQTTLEFVKQMQKLSIANFFFAKDVQTDLGPIRLNEVFYVVRNLKTGKARGPDEKSAEMLKAHDGIAHLLWNIIDRS